MTDVRFYHLTKSPFEKALPQLVEKIYKQDKRAVIQVGSEERLKSVDNFLWTYSQSVFLPHGTEADGRPEEQPVWITLKDENPNQSEVLILCDSTNSDHVKDFNICCEIFDGYDDQAVSNAREKWKSYKEQGFQVSYWQQGEKGGWSQK